MNGPLERLKFSSNEETVKMLGYKWTTEADLLCSGLGESNMNKKVKCIKKPILSPVKSWKEAEKLLSSVISQENQLKTQGLDGCKFLDFIEIEQPVPVVLEDSLV